MILKKITTLDNFSKRVRSSKKSFHLYFPLCINLRIYGTYLMILCLISSDYVSQHFRSLMIICFTFGNRNWPWLLLWKAVLVHQNLPLMHCYIFSLISFKSMHENFKPTVLQMGSRSKISWWHLGSLVVWKCSQINRFRTSQKVSFGM